MDYPVFSTTDFDVKGTGTVKQIVLRHASMDVVIVGNFAITSRTATPLFTKSGKWYEFTKNDSLDVVAGTTKLDLKAGEFRIFSTSRIANNGLNIGIEDPIGVSDIKLYPNPVKGLLNVDFELNRSRSVILTVYDLSGKIVLQTERSSNIGLNQIQINVSGLKPGLYILKGVSENQQFTGKFSVAQ